MAKAYASNMDEVRKIIADRVELAMNEAQKKVYEELKKAVLTFYTVHPKVYVRTGFLRNSPKVDNVYRYTDHVSFRALLDGGKHSYTTGDKPSAEQVFELANYGNAWRTKSGAYARDTVGRKGFWEKGLVKMEKAFNSALKNYFK